MVATYNVGSHDKNPCLPPEREPKSVLFITLLCCPMNYGIEIFALQDQKTDYNKLTPELLQAIQGKQEVIDSQQASTALLEKEIQKLLEWKK